MKFSNTQRTVNTEVNEVNDHSRKCCASFHAAALEIIKSLKETEDTLPQKACGNIAYLLWKNLLKLCIYKNHLSPPPQILVSELLIWLI